MDFKCVILGKLNQRQRQMLYDANYMWNLKNKTSECNKKNRFVDTGSRWLLVGRGSGEGQYRRRGLKVQTYV